MQALNFRGLTPGADRELNFVINSWLKSYKKSRWIGPLPDNLYWDTIGKTIRQLISRENAQLELAICSEDPNQILGYCLSESGHRLPVIHYVYVKQSFRKYGIGRTLIERATKKSGYYYTHRTGAEKRIPSEIHSAYKPDIVRRRAVNLRSR